MSPLSLAAVLRCLQTAPGSPRVTWYGHGGERVELSGAVLDNWVTKTANLLVDELDAAPGVDVRIDLPPHWRTLVWALATWRVGACVMLPQPTDTVRASDVDVTDEPLPAGRGGQTVAVALPALARTFGGHLPAGALDAASAVMTYPDTLGWTPDTDPDSPAVTGPGAPVPHRDLLTWASGAVSVDAGARVLLPLPSGPGPEATRWFLRAALGVLRESGSVVLMAPDAVPDEARRASLMTSERVTAVIDGPTAADA